MLYNFENESLEMPIYAIDTNVLILLYEANCGKIGKSSNPEWYKKGYKEACFLLNLLKQKKIALVVPITVLYEANKLSQMYNANYIDFAKSKIFLAYNMEKLKEKKDEIKNIAKFYARTLSLEDYRIRTVYGATQKTQSHLVKGILTYSYSKKGKPTKDAFVMAEAADFGLELITLDQDFLKSKNPEKISFKNSLIGLSENAIPISTTTACREIMTQLHIGEIKKVNQITGQQFSGLSGVREFA